MEQKTTLKDKLAALRNKGPQTAFVQKPVESKSEDLAKFAIPSQRNPLVFDQNGDRRSPYVLKGFRFRLHTSPSKAKEAILGQTDETETATVLIDFIGEPVKQKAGTLATADITERIIMKQVPNPEYKKGAKYPDILITTDDLGREIRQAHPNAGQPIPEFLEEPESSGIAVAFCSVRLIWGNSSGLQNAAVYLPGNRCPKKKNENYTNVDWSALGSTESELNAILSTAQQNPTLAEILSFVPTAKKQETNESRVPAGVAAAVSTNTTADPFDEESQS